MTALLWSKTLSVVGAALILFALTFALDPDGSLGTDTGGKLATIHAMVERGDWSPDLGYWAEESDVDGSLHPFFGMRETDKGWINVTTLPMILTGRLLAGALGLRAIFLFPILGTVLAAAGAAAMSRRLGGQSWHLPFWTVALGSPLVVYALDFWEHSMGVALMVWGTVFVLDSRRATPGMALPYALSAGLLFGSAGTMRQEAYIYGFVAGIVIVLLNEGPSLVRRVRLSSGFAMVVGAAIPFWGNFSLERAIFGEHARAGRAVGVVTSGGQNLPLRVKEALVTVAGPVGDSSVLALAMAGLVATSLIWMALASVSGTSVQRPAALVGLLILFLFLQLVLNGPTFVPGLLAACPLAVLGIVVGYRRRMAAPLVLAIGPIPLILLFQYVGAALAQWGGRYLLSAGIMLSAVALSQLDTKNRILRGFVAANFVMAALGLAMLTARTDGFGSANRELAARSDSVLIFNDPFIARTAAPVGWDERWLSAFYDEEKAEAARLLKSAAIPSFIFVAYPEDSEAVFPGFEVEGSELIEYGGLFPMQLTSYVLEE